MKKLLSLTVLMLSITASADSVVSLSCLKHLIEIEKASKIEQANAQEESLIAKAKADIAKKDKDLVKYFTVVRSKIKALTPSPYAVLPQYGIEIEYCDDADYAQSNCYSYIYSANVRNLTLMAIYDIPHSGAEETVKFICE
jgi:hypothetical protein